MKSLHTCKHAPPPGEVQWCVFYKGKRRDGVEAQTWFEARHKYAALLGCLELSELNPEQVEGRDDATGRETATSGS